MFAAMMEGILYLKSTKMNLKLNNTNQLVAISEPLVYKKRFKIIDRSNPYMDYQEERGSGETLSYYVAMIAPEF